MDDDVLKKLEQRLGLLHARQRLGIERDHEAQIFGQGLNFFHIENWYSIHALIRLTLKLSGLYWRGVRNAGTSRSGTITFPHRGCRAVSMTSRCFT
jgi:hypothetical protein